MPFFLSHPKSALFIRTCEKKIERCIATLKDKGFMKYVKDNLYIYNPWHALSMDFCGAAGNERGWGKFEL